MRVLFDNVAFDSRSGPNSFARQLRSALMKLGHQSVEAKEKPDVQLAFIQASAVLSNAPTVQRLDGIWFNSEQDWRLQNEAIEATFQLAKSVIVQSEFDKRLVTEFFGAHSSMHVIHNGVDVSQVQFIAPLDVPTLAGEFDRVWSCAASWRPHKRLADNIRYFKEHAGPRECLIVAGANPDKLVSDPQVFYIGDQDKHVLFAMMRASDVFLHLAWLDHCPNSVVEARAAGCQIVCSSAGGTEEVAGPDAVVIEEDEWDFKPCKLYQPPPMDFSRKRQGRFDVSIDINDVAERYVVVLQGAIDG